MVGTSIFSRVPQSKIIKTGCMETTCNAAETTFCRKDLSLLPRGLQALYDDFSCQVTRNIYRILANIYKQTACKYLIFVKKWQAHLNIVFQDEHVKWRMGSFPVRGYGFDRCNILVHYISRWRLRHQMKTTPPNNFLCVCVSLGIFVSCEAVWCRAIGELHRFLYESLFDNLQK